MSVVVAISSVVDDTEEESETAVVVEQTVFETSSAEIVTSFPVSVVCSVICGAGVS